MHATRTTARLGELAADEWGAPDDRPTLVLMHGLSFDRYTWHATAAALQEIDPGRHVLAVDLPGHGESAAPANPRLGDGSRAIAHGLRQRGLTAPVLVGHSAAAVEATFYAVEYPVSGIVNVDTDLQVKGFAAMLRQLADRYERDYPAIWRDVLLPSLRIAQLPVSAQVLLAAHSTPTRDVLAAGWDEVIERPPGELAQQMTAALFRLREAQTPYVTVFGDAPPPDYAGWLAAQLPQSRVEVWPGHTHFPQLADPERFARVLAATADW
jgi:pimeloyl-ACP methyl ester carboxylesterase